MILESDTKFCLSGTSWIRKLFPISGNRNLIFRAIEITTVNFKCEQINGL